MNLIVDNDTSLVLVCTDLAVAEAGGVYTVGGEKVGIATTSASLLTADSAPQYFYPQVYTYAGNTWTVADQSLYDLCYQQQCATFNLGQKNKRHAAYIAESDPIFFKSQRGEATQQQWLDAVAAIDARFPYMT